MNRVDRITAKEVSVFLLGSVLVGVLASVFAIASDWMDHRFYRLAADHPWAPFLLTPLGLVLVAWLTRRWLPGAEGSGIPQCMVAQEGVARVSHLLTWPMAIGKGVLVLLALGSGASVGRVGPTVHIGAAVMSSLGRLAKLPAHRWQKALVLTGGAAGVSAAFNAPLIGLIFAIEELARIAHKRMAWVMLLGVALAGGVAAQVNPTNYDYHPALPDQVSWETLLLLMLPAGVLAGACGAIFSRSLMALLGVLRPLMKRWWVLLALAAGLITAVLGWFSGGLVHGTGYLEAREIVQCSGSLAACEVTAGVWYPLQKALATMVSFSSGIPGGLFAPSLAVGAGLGADMALWFDPQLAGVVVVFGLVGYFTGVVGTPVTAFAIGAMLLGDPQYWLALLLTALIAAGISRMLMPVPVHAAMAEVFIKALLAKEKA